MLQWINEQRIERQIRQAHESDGPVMRIDRDPKRQIREQHLDFEIDRRPVLGCQEIMSRIDGTTPNADDLMHVRWSSRPNFRHDPTRKV